MGKKSNKKLSTRLPHIRRVKKRDLYLLPLSGEKTRESENFRKGRLKKKEKSVGKNSNHL